MVEAVPDPATAENEKPQRQQRLFTQKVQVDEARFRIRGSITLSADDDQYTHGDVVEIVTKARVVEISTKEHESGLKVLEYTLRPESSSLTLVES